MGLAQLRISRELSRGFGPFVPIVLRLRDTPRETDGQSRRNSRFSLTLALP